MKSDLADRGATKQANSKLDKNPNNCTKATLIYCSDWAYIVKVEIL